MDQEQLLSETLTEAVLRLKDIVNNGKSETAIRAAKTLLHYTKIANDVLGLKIKPVEEQEPLEELTMTADELIEEHRREIEKLEATKASDAN